MDSDLSSRPTSLKVPLHPALLLGCALVLGAGLRWVKPQPMGLPEPWGWVFPITAMLGAFTLAAWCFFTFKRHGSSPEYGKPVQALLSSGP